MKNSPSSTSKFTKDKREAKCKELTFDDFIKTDFGSYGIPRLAVELIKIFSSYSLE